jgi:hypothetical protein
MSERQIALNDRIGDLMELLDVLLDKGIVGVTVETPGNGNLPYDIRGVSDTLAGLAAEVASSDATEIAALEEAFADERRHVMRIIGRLAEMAASPPSEDDFNYQESESKSRI